MYRILIVEDDEIIARSLKKHLESWDYDVVCVEDFSDVMKEFAGAAPQLVLMDTPGFHKPRTRLDDYMSDIVKDVFSTLTSSCI